MDICRDMEELCPTAWLLNYVNPMAMNCWALSRATTINTIGLCHSVPETLHTLATDIDVPVDEIEFLCAGINHMAFFLELKRQGMDLYPLVYQVLEGGRVPPENSLRYEMLKRGG